MQAVESLVKELALELPLKNLHLSGSPDLAVQSSFKLGQVAQATIGLAAFSAVHLDALRTGRSQSVSVDARHAVLEFNSTLYYSRNANKSRPPSLWDDLSGMYRTADSNYVRIHTNFPHHKQGIVDLLRCQPTKQSISLALSSQNSFSFESDAASGKMCASAMRTFSQWDAHPHAKALIGVPPVEIIKVGNAPKRPPCPHAKSPLDGIRVLDLTRVLAGPICGRSLAAFGADVRWVTSPNLPDLPDLDIETSRGKRTTQLDLTQSGPLSQLEDLTRQSDVFLQAYRPGGLSSKGFGVRDVVELRPGIVYANLTAYGYDGPWKDKRGFDSLVQTATGFNHAEGLAFSDYHGRAFEPRPFPMQAIDHAAGYLLTLGIITALGKTITEGGSWEVRVSLAAVGQWIRSLGRTDLETAFGQAKAYPSRNDPEIIALSHETEKDGDKETLTVLRHAYILSETPVREGIAPLSLNAHEAEWLETNL
ncbi:CoA-transferase family III [Sistotremastrum niveocremeum HHB9708]|uniref:CoA-transferase family III n=1 Tax=Sistotremastrum niveocremeum HHB9708 TaxID=1314777 RepID=A0A164MR01_9AGAM|nr:CoA-transferase family III [Sistotremastrum niveocremeum HHB9708]